MKQFFDFYFKNVSFKIALTTISEKTSKFLYLIDFKNQVAVFVAPLFWFLVLNIIIIFITDFYNRKIRVIKYKKNIISKFKNSNTEELNIFYIFYDQQQNHFLSTKSLVANNGSVMLLHQKGLIFPTSDFVYENRLTGEHKNTYSLNRIILNYLNDNKEHVLKTHFNFMKGR